MKSVFVCALCAAAMACAPAGQASDAGPAPAQVVGSFVASSGGVFDFSSIGEASALYNDCWGGQQLLFRLVLSTVPGHCGALQPNAIEADASSIVLAISPGSLTSALAPVIVPGTYPFGTTDDGDGGTYTASAIVYATDSSCNKELADMTGLSGSIAINAFTDGGVEGAFTIQADAGSLSGTFTAETCVWQCVPMPALVQCVDP